MSEPKKTANASNNTTEIVNSKDASTYTLNLIRGNLSKCTPIRIFKTDIYYIWSPKLPPSSVSDPEFDHYKRRMIAGRQNRWVHLHFTGENCSYWYNSKHCAVVIGTYFYLCPIAKIDETVLRQNNFINKKIAPMPFDLSGCYIPKNFQDILTDAICPFTDSELKNL